MTDALVGLPIVAIVALALGAGWSAVLRRAAPWGFLGFIFRAWVCAIATTSLVWSWAYPLNLDVRWGIALQLAVCIAGYAVAVRLRSFDGVRQEANVGVLAQLVVPFVLTLIALLPAMVSFTHLSIAERIGPDSLGYAISARAIDQGLTHDQIVHDVLRESGGHSISNVISPDTKLIDTTPSFTTQVQGEFLEGADRWGYAGAVGSILFVIGDNHLWSLLSLLSGFALFATCVGIWACIRWRGYSVYCALFATMLLALSPSLLNAWHEGGLGQIWMMPAVLMLVSPIARLGDGDRVGRAFAAGLGVASIIPAYNTNILMFGVLFGCATLISIPMVRRKWWFEWSGIFGGALLGAIAVLPSSVQFLTTLNKSLSENQNAGWMQTHWASLGEAFGLSNAYSTPQPGLVIRSFENRLFDGLGSVLVLLFLVALCRRRTSRASFVLLVSTLLVAAAIYYDTRYIASASNYQYFKAIATLAPAGALAIGLLLGEPRSASSRDSVMTRIRSRLQLADRVVVATATLIVVAVSFSVFSYISDYRREGSTVKTSFADLATSRDAQAVFDRYNIVGPALGQPANPYRTTLDTYALGTVVNLRFIGRSWGTPPTRLGPRIPNPVGIVIFQTQCPRYTCLSKVDEKWITYKDSGVAVVQLGPDTKELSQLSEKEWAGWIAGRYTQLGGTLPGLMTIGPPR